MQVTETLNEGLKREIQIVVPATELDSRLSARLEQLRGQVKLNGFRPGKVPTAHLRRLYGMLLAKNVPVVKTTDHKVGYGLYFTDPDGHRFRIQAPTE